MDNRQLSTGIGAVAGAAAGTEIAKRTGTGRVVAGVAGAAIGGLIGNKIGQYLDEQGKKRAIEATTKTANTGQQQQFRTASGATVTTAPAPAAAAPATQTASRECRTVRQTIALQNGTRESEDITMCKGPDGWQAV